MAYLEVWNCCNCLITAYSERPKDGLCKVCNKEAEDKKYKEHFSILDALTIEQRLRLIEEWQYESAQQYTQPYIRRQDG